MAVLRITEWSGSEQQYDASGQAVNDAVGLSDQLTFHAMCMTGHERFMVTEVWQSEEALREWWPKAESAILSSGVTAAGEEQVFALYNVQMAPTTESMSAEPKSRMQEA